MSKLFDIAAFWPSKNHAVEPCGMAGIDSDHPALDAWRLDRSSLRSSVILDSSSCRSVFFDWMGRQNADVGTLLKDAFLRSMPPWDNSFVLAESAGRDTAVGVHTQVLPTSGSGERFTLFSSHQFPGDAQFACICRTWFQLPNRLRVHTRLQPFFVFVDHCGQILGVDSAQTTMDGSVATKVDSLRYGFDGYQPSLDASEDLMDMALFWMLFAFWSFQVANCRNVKVVESTRNAILPKGKNRKPPKLKFRTLEIQSTTYSRESPLLGDSSNLESKTAKHVCRGNFAHYTEENKLFGKYVGMFWRPMHIRGNAKHGIVGKEYSLDEPNELTEESQA